jgi:hypothetical protein
MVEPNLEPNAVDSVTVAEPMCAKVITLAELGRVAVAKVRARNIKLMTMLARNRYPSFAGGNHA